MLEVKGVSKVYGEGQARVVALDNINMRVGRGEFVAITGPSGSGKSTLLNVIGGLDRISKGEVVLDGIRIDNLGESQLVDIRRHKMSYVFQQYHLIPSLTALENVLLPLAFRGHCSDDERRVKDLLARVGLANRASHKPGELSGGEQQRVAIARALANNCSLLLADEPTGNLDRKTGADILCFFDELNQEGYSILMVTHDSDTARHARRRVVLEDGRIVGEIDMTCAVSLV
jgi:putative ABC transport system ATP-binding protein